MVCSCLEDLGCCAEACFYVSSSSFRGGEAGNGAGGYAEEQKRVLSLNNVLVRADCLGFWECT